MLFYHIAIFPQNIYIKSLIEQSNNYTISELVYITYDGRMDINVQIKL